MGHFLKADKSDQEKEQVISRLLQAVTLGWAKAPCSQGYEPIPSAFRAHRLEGPKRKFQLSVLSFSLSPTNAHALKNWDLNILAYGIS
jgi:hypothetical protein